MIRLVTQKRLALLEADTHAAFERARKTSEAANQATERHTSELNTVTDRAERAEAATFEVSETLAHAFAELTAAQEELLLKDIEIRRLRQEREELEGGPVEGQTLTVLLHYGEPHTIYATLAEAHADTATHGVPADHEWTPCGERPPAASRWRCEPFTYRATSHGFRRAFMPTPEPLGGAA